MADTSSTCLPCPSLARSGKHHVGFSAPHTRGKVSGTAQGSPSGTGGMWITPSRGKVSKATPALRAWPAAAAPGAQLALPCWRCHILPHAKWLLVYVTAPGANTKGTSLTGVDFTCSTLTRDKEVKHKYTNPTTSASSGTLLKHKGHEHSTPRGSGSNQTPATAETPACRGQLGPRAPLCSCKQQQPSRKAAACWGWQGCRQGACSPAASH